MNKLWIIPVSLLVIGYFGMFWALSLSDIDIDITMDNNTRDALQAISKLNIQPITIYNSTVIIYGKNDTLQQGVKNES